MHGGPARLTSFLTAPHRTQVLPLEDAKAVEKIEETFHLTLLRDHMLRPTMDEANLTSLSSLIFFKRCVRQ